MPHQAPPPETNPFLGCLLGTAVGDARGLPYEGLSRRRLNALYPKRNRYHLLAGYGLCSDDTEHAFMVGQALLASYQAYQASPNPAHPPANSAPKADFLHSRAPTPQQAFLHSLAWRLRFWLLGLPAGIGMATLRSLCKLWLGVSPEKSGVFSAGNGPAMRAALLGLWCDDLPRLRAFVSASTRLTHTDPQALSGALLIAWTARYAATAPIISPAAYRQALTDSGLLADEPLRTCWQKTHTSLEAGDTPEAFAARLNCSQGIGGYMGHTVPAVLHTFLRHPQDFEAALAEIIGYGGDTDSTAAIVGALVGIRVGEPGIPPYWLQHLAEYPRSVKQMRRLAHRLHQARHASQTAPPAGSPTALAPLPCLPLAAPAILCRNLLFIPLVLVHGFRRLLPPYR